MKNIATALVTAQRNFAPALKSSTNPHFKSRYADLSSCVEAVIDALNSAGIALMQKCYECENGVTVETVFIHESGEMLDAGKLHVPASKADAQGYGSALTYARRYSLMAACGIAPEDDDGNAASRAPAANTPRLPFYPADDFKKNLPSWRKAIAGGKKTADAIISMVSTKGTLTDEQKAAIRAPAVAEPPAEDLFAQVKAGLEKAQSLDALDLAADLIKSVADEQQRAELSALYQQRLEDLT